MLLGASFGSPLLAVLKTSDENCKSATLNIYDFRSAFDPYTITLPRVPLLVAETNISNEKQFIFWFSKQHQSCRNDLQKVANESSNGKETKARLSLSDVNNLSMHGPAADDVTDNLDIETIDKDVLNNLREYVGIDEKGVTRHHKLFHLVCNYLLLRFLISYGITTESVLKDFKSTRNHLLNLSNRNLGKALTDQLKGLLANDYDKDINIPPWFDEIENDIDWLRDPGDKSNAKAKRDTYSLSEADEDLWYAGRRMQLASLDEDESGESTPAGIPESLKMMLSEKEEGATSEMLMSKLVTGLKDKASWQNQKAVGSRKELERLEEKESDREEGRFNATASCYLPKPKFESLLIGKAEYKWLNVTTIQDGGRPQIYCLLDFKA